MDIRKIKGLKILSRLFLILMLALGLMGCSGRESQEALEDDSSKVIYYVTKRTIEHNTGDINVDEYTYDENWNLLSQKLFLNGKFQSSVENDYREDYTQVEVTNTSSTSEVSKSKIEQRFDESGRLLEAVSYSDGEETGSTKYFYDDNGRQSQLITKYTNSDTVIIVSYEYDKYGNQTSYVVDTGAYISEKEYLYDEEQKLCRINDYRNEELVSYMEYRWEENTQYGDVYDSEKQLVGKTMNVFDEAGNSLIEESYDVSGAMIRRMRYEYVGTDGSISSGMTESESEQ